MFDGRDSAKGVFVGRREQTYDFTRRDTGERVKGSKQFLYFADGEGNAQELRTRNPDLYSMSLGWKIGQPVTVTVAPRAENNRVVYELVGVDVQ